MKKFMNNFDKRLFIRLFISFIFATIIGTLLHELGHYFTMECLGFKGHINYKYSWYEKSFPEQIITPTDNFLITLGGPIETMLTGTIGLLLIYIFRESFVNKIKFSLVQW